MKRYLLITALAVSAGCNSGGGTGNTGTSGTTGGSGTTGTAGTTGGSGTTGTAGTTGGSGTTGTAGTTGVAGTTGTAGTTGAAGTTGVAGTTGAAGAAGTTGAAGRGGTTGTAGAGGRGGTTGTAGTTGTGGAVTSNQNVLERNKNPSKDGHFIQPTLTKAAAATMMPDTAFNTAATFTGNVLGTVLYLDGSPGKFFVGTSSNNVVARNENGTEAWPARTVGTPVTGMLGCGSFATATPLGILSTGVIDATSRTLYVAAIIGGASGPTGHIVSGINTDDGTVRTGWPVNVSTMLSFDPVIHNQRSALSLVNGIVYVSYGGFVGDCGSYRGRVVAVSTATPGTMGQWSTGGVGEGIWHMGGTASDGNGVITVTGNRTSGSGAHADSEQVTRITGMGTKADYFYPTDWMAKDSADADFGSVNPVVVNVPGATPSSLVAAISKDGHFYLLNAAMLRGTTSGTAAGGQIADFTIASSGMSIHSVPASYRTAMGTYVIISTTSGSQGCPAGSGGTGGRRVMAIRLNAANLAQPTIAWCAEMATVTTGAIATTTDGTSDAVVWYTSGGSLRGVDGDTGAVLYMGNSCAGVARWTTPIAVKGRIVVAGNGRLCAWGIPGALTAAHAKPLKGKHQRKLASASGAQY